MPKIYRSIKKIAGEATYVNLYLSYNYRVLFILSRKNIWYPILIYVFIDEAENDCFMKTDNVDLPQSYKIEDAVVASITQINRTNVADIDDLQYVIKLQPHEG